MEKPLLISTHPHRGLAGLTLSCSLLLAACTTTPLAPSPMASDSAATSAPAAPESPPAIARVSVPLALPEALAATVTAPLPPAAVSRTRIASDRDSERASLWDRIRGRWALADLDGERVAKWEQYYARKPDYVQRMVARGSLYLFHIVEEVEKRQLPAELALLPFIESAFNPQAQSHARASGMWQFMPATGKDFELRQNVFRDDRRDVLASTRAALDYLQRLHGLFGDWHLALAAYNWGRGNVTRAQERNRRAGLPTDYLSLRMPQETRDYVPKLQAVKNIVVDAARLGLSLPAVENHPYFLSVSIERDIDVALAASTAGLPLEEFQALNPQLNKPVILAAGTPQVLLPYDNANRFIRELPLVTSPLASWTAWVAPRTLKPADAARLVGMSETQLREVNRIPPRMLVKAGSTLLVPRAAHITADVTETVADNGSMALASEGRALRRMSFKAGQGGDSVADVARRYRVSADSVAEWNQVSAQARFKPGATVVVMVAASKAKPSARPAASRPAAQKAAARPAARAAAAEPARKATAGAPRAQFPQAAPR